MSWSLRTPWVRRRLRAWARRGDAAGDLLYVAIGDSAAQGIGARSLDRGYVGLLAARFARASGRTVRVVNLSRYGARIDDAVERQLPAMRALGREPDLVTVAIGANDMGAYDAERFAASVDRLLAGLPSHAIVADLPCFHGGPREERAVAASAVVAAAVARRGLAFAPLHRVTELRRGWRSFPEFSWDQFHPSALGYRVWASAFSGAVVRRARRVVAEDLTEP